MVRAKLDSSSALAREIHRICQPTNSAKANKLSSAVVVQDSAGMIAEGRNQLSLATYALKCERSPQLTPFAPGCPHIPKRSATADANAAANAIRNNKTAV